MSASIEQVADFWDRHPCGADQSHASDRRQYFAEIETERYHNLKFVPEIARFRHFSGQDVLEIGCGVGTDGIQFAHGGARYTGVDLTATAIALTQENFALAGRDGAFYVANAESLPFANESFDHIYCLGVIHHTPHPDAVAGEMLRVLRPGGTFTLMVYNRNSINYYVEIQAMRRLFRQALRPAFMPALVAKLTGVDKRKLERHREILLQQRKMTAQQWLSMNTDGPNCPLARVYSSAEVEQLFARFGDVRTEVRYFDRKHWPLLSKLVPESLVGYLGNHWGWARIVHGAKPDCRGAGRRQRAKAAPGELVAR